MEELDRVDRSTDIDATPEKVWGLVFRPGWWINSRTLATNQDVCRPESGAGRVALVHDPVHATTPIAVELDAFRAHVDPTAITRAVRVAAPVKQVRAEATWEDASVEMVSA